MCGLHFCFGNTLHIRIIVHEKTISLKMNIWSSMGLLVFFVDPNARFSRNWNHWNWNGTSWGMVCSLRLNTSSPLAQSVCGISALLTLCHFTVLLHPDSLTWLKQTHLCMYVYIYIYVYCMSQCHRSKFWGKLNSVAFSIFYFLLLICSKKTISCILGLAHNNKSLNGPPYTTLFIQKLATCFSHICLSSGFIQFFFILDLLLLHDL